MGYILKGSDKENIFATNQEKQIDSTGIVSNDCENKKVGDYCFTNMTTIKLVLTIIGNFKSQSFNLEGGQTKCLYSLAAKNWTYKITKAFLPQSLNNTEIYWEDFKTRRGEFLVQKCKSKTFVINKY